MANALPALNPLPLKDSNGGALNLTRFTGLGAALVTVLTTFNKSFVTIFGKATSDWVKPAVIMSVIATFAVVAAADILGRAYVAGRRGELVRLPEGLVAAYTPKTDERVSVVAVRYRRTQPDDSEFLVIKEDKSTLWATSDELDFAKVPAAAN
jgi:hypothetical protein